MRLVYAYNILGAGVVGAILLLAPGFATRQLFAGTMKPDASTAVLGSIWLAVGALSVLGLFFPAQMSSIFLVQLVYKMVWLLGVALPAVLVGRAGSISLVMTAMFVVWVVVLPFAIPFGRIFGAWPGT